MPNTMSIQYLPEHEFRALVDWVVTNVQGEKIKIPTNATARYRTVFGEWLYYDHSQPPVEVVFRSHDYAQKIHYRLEASWKHGS